MTEYKSNYINKTWNEIITSFDWVNCQPVNCRISHHKKHYDWNGNLFLDKFYIE